MQVVPTSEELLVKTDTALVESKEILNQLEDIRMKISQIYHTYSGYLKISLNEEVKTKDREISKTNIIDIELSELPIDVNHLVDETRILLINKLKTEFYNKRNNLISILDSIDLA